MIKPLKHIVMFSGGVASWVTAKRVVEKHGSNDLILCFADTLIEDEDLYRFVREGSDYLGGLLVWLKEGRDPWQVFFDGKMMGNSRVDPCSRILKRELIRQWLEDNYRPEKSVIYLGFDWNEGHRFERARQYWDPWTIAAPLLEPPYLTKQSLIGAVELAGIKAPRLYRMGFSHNNCGGFCVKAGMATFRLLLDKMPERYAHHEDQERKFREMTGKDVSILTDRSNGERTPLTLEEFRERVARPGRQLTLDEMYDFGGCGCMTPTEDA